MRVSDFPGCCGGVIFSGFGHVPSEAEPNHSVKEVEDFLEKHEAHQGKTLRKAFALITLTTTQNGVFSKMLEARGYNRTKAGANYAWYGANIHVWIKELNTRERH